MLQLTLRFAVFAKKICVYYIGIHLYFQPEKLDCIYIFVNSTTYMVYGCAATKKFPAENSSGKKPCYNSTLANDKYSYRCFSCKKTHQTLRCVAVWFVFFRGVAEPKFWGKFVSRQRQQKQCHSLGDFTYFTLNFFLFMKFNCEIWDFDEWELSLQPQQSVEIMLVFCRSCTLGFFLRFDI